MICNLANNESYKPFRKYIFKKLSLAPEGFTLESFTKDIYRKVYDNTTGTPEDKHANAINHVAIGTIFLNRIQALEPSVYDTIKDIDFNKFIKLINNISKAEPDFSSLEEMLGLKNNPVEELKELNAAAAESRDNSTAGIQMTLFEGSDIKVNEEDEPADTTNNNMVTATEEYQGKDTVQADQDRETINIDNPKSSDYYKANPLYRFYYKVKRGVLKLLQRPETNFDSSQITIPYNGKKGVYLTVMSSSKLNRDDFKEDPAIGGSNDKKFIYDAGEPVFVLTDVDGIPVKFNEEGQFDENGKLSYHKFRNIYSTQVKDGKVSLYKSANLNALDDVKRVDLLKQKLMKLNPGLSEKNAKAQAEKTILDQLQIIYDIRQALKANPNLIVKTVINGGSMGAVKKDISVKTPLENLTIGNRDFTIHAVKSDSENSGYTYTNTDATGSYDIEITRPDISQVEGLTDTIVSILFDKGISKDKGVSKTITAETRKELLQNYIFTRTEGLDMFVNEDGGYTVKIGGQEIYRLKNKNYTSVEEAALLEKRKSAEKLVREYFTTLAPQAEILEKDLNDVDMKNIIEGTIDKVRDQFKKGYVFYNTENKKYYRIGYPIHHINAKYQNATYPGLTLSKEGNNTIFTIDRNASYNNYIKKNFTIPFELNESGEIPSLNAFYTYEYAEGELNKIYKPAESTSVQPSTSVKPATRKTYSGKVTKLTLNQIFVFGSNPEGRHGAGAAKYAKDNFGALYGQGEGLQGQSYALPTKDLRIKTNNSLRSISAEDITKNIKKLYEVARQNPAKDFLVSDYSETNLNGYTGQEMADMFSAAGPIPNNIVFHKNFDKLITTQPSTSVNKGVEISSNAKGLAAALTNPTELAKSKGNIKQSYPIYFQWLDKNGEVRDSNFKDVEQAYQKLKDNSEAKTKPTKENSNNYKLMVDLIKAKLEQHPRLVLEITKQGGSAWILSSTHQPTKQNTVWETGGQNWFIQALNDAYLSTQPSTSISVDTKADITLPTTIDEQNINSIDRAFDIENDAINNFNKLKALKLIDQKATVEQIEAAKKWWESHPMSSKIPLYVLFNAVNTKNPTSIANWTLDGITLYQGADYSDLYHEAWHGFTQMFLTKEQKENLYKEVGKKSGGFTDYKGNYTLFKDAKPKQLEEYLAEDFRNYMLSGGKKIAGKAPVRNKIFKFIADILEWLFGNLTREQIANGTESLSTIHDLYEKLRVGNLSEYTFSQSNSQYDKLSKGEILATRNTDKPVDDIDTKNYILNMVDSFLSEFVDKVSEGKRKKYIADAKTQAEARGETFIESTAELSYKYTATLLKTAEGRKTAYNYTKAKIKAIYDGLVKLQATETSEIVKANRQKVLDTLKWTYNNFGDINNLKNNKIDKDGRFQNVIAFHNAKSRLFTKQEKELFFSEDALNEEDLFLLGRDGLGSAGGNEKSSKELASEDILIMINSLHEVDAKGNTIYVEGTEVEVESNGVKLKIGIPKLQDFDVTWNILSKKLENNQDAENMYAILSDLAKSRPNLPFKQLLNKLGPIKTAGSAEFRLWTNFWQTFNLSRVGLVYNKVNITTKTESKGEVKELNFDNWEFTARPTKATTSINTIKKNWDYAFRMKDKGDYIGKDSLGQNYLLLDKVLRKFEGDIKGKELEFFKAIGIDFDTNNEDILKEVSSKNSLNTAERIYTIIKALSNAKYENGNSKYIIYTPSQLFQEIYEIGEDKQYVWENKKKKNLKTTGYKTSGEATRFDKLAEIQAEYSDKWGTNQVTNAEGNTQFDLTLNNFLTVLKNTLNQVEGVRKDDVLIPAYKVLISLPWMSHLDVDKNPDAESSALLNSLFDLNKTSATYGHRKLDPDTKSGFVEVELKNLSGVAFNKDDVYDEKKSTSLFNSDPLTKLVADFHTGLMNGNFELMRHSDKGTSFSFFTTSLDKKNINNRNKYLYVDTADFVTSLGTKNAINKYIFPTLNSEFKRIKKFRNIKQAVEDARKETDPEKKKDMFKAIGNTDFNYIEKGSSFVTFQGVLSPETKVKILKQLDKNSLTEYLNTPEGFELKVEIGKDIQNYFNNQIEVVSKKFPVRRSGVKLISDDIIKKIKDHVTANYTEGLNLSQTGKDILRNTDFNKVALRSFVINSWIHNTESIKLVYGNLAQYNMAKEEFHKRNAGSSSTGTLYRTDKAAMDYVNNILNGGDTYAKSIGQTNRYYDGTLNTAIVQDSVQRSVYIEDYSKDLIAEQLKRNGGNQREAEKKVFGYDEKNNKVGTLEKPIKGGLITAYTDMKEGDGQGWVSFDSYRMLLNLEGKWSDSQENLYQKIVKGEQVSSADIAFFFPPQKLQYWGPLGNRLSGKSAIGQKINSDVQLTAMHKFSLVPLIPTVIKDKRIQKLHDKMVREQVDYVTFESGSKISNITSAEKFGENGKQTFDLFYADDKRNISEEPFTINPIYVNYLKNQLEIAPKFKKKVTFSTQLRKLIEDGLVENGVPIDFGRNLSREERIKAWDAITTEEAKMAASPKYKIYKTYENKLKKLTELKRDQLLEEMGWKMVNGKPVGTIENLVRFVKAELERQNLGDHEIDFLDVVDGGTKLKTDASFSLSADKIEKLLNSIVVNRLIKQKINGEALIQVSTAGYENNEAWDGARGATEEDLEKWGTDDLPTYRKGNKLKTLVKQNIFTVEPRQTADKKAVIKASLATQYIGFGEGIENSSTELYRQQAGQYANTGNYSSADTIFVSVGGKRPQNNLELRKTQQDKTIKEAIKALEAGATLITDNAAYTESSSYNEGEKRLAANLKAKGYSYTEQTIDGQLLGVWNKIDTTTKAMKVKVALQGKFLSLLNLNHNDGQTIAVYDIVNGKKVLNLESSRTRLNSMIKNEEWLNKENHRKMITMVGVRIPVQGLNSMEFMEVYEFLPEEAGNIIIPPTEIVAKSGADFDIDKLTVMMPNIKTKINKTKITNALLKELGEKNPTLDFSRDNINMLLDFEKGSGGAYTLTEEDLNTLRILEETSEVSVVYPTGDNSIEGLENDLIWNIKDILALPENFVNLITPNSTDTVQPIATKLAPLVKDYDQMQKTAGDITTLSKEDQALLNENPNVMEGTRVLEILYNISKQQYNQIGKETLGIGAVDNTFNILLNRIGAYMNAYATVKSFNGKNKTTIRQTLKFKHNTLNINGQDVISLSHLYDNNDLNRVSDIISQMMNGWVDVAKDAWIFDIQGNKDLSPTLLFMIQAGVSIENAIYMVSQPMVREYVRLKKTAQSSVSDVITNVDTKFPGFAAKKMIIDKYFSQDADFGSQIAAANNIINDEVREKKLNAIYGNVNVANTSAEVINRVFGDNDIDTKKMEENIQIYSAAEKNGEDTNKLLFNDEYQKAIFLHFLQIEQMGSALTNVKKNMNFDTKKDASIYEAQNRMVMIDALSKEDRFPSKMIDKLITDSPISSFYIQEFQTQIWEKLLPLRTNEVFNKWLSGKMGDQDFKSYVEENFGENMMEKAILSLRNNLVPYIFQNELKQFDLRTLDGYKGNIVEISEKGETEQENLTKKQQKEGVSVLSIGAFFKDGKMFIDKKSLDNQYNNASYLGNENSTYKELGLASVSVGTFSSLSEYHHFVVEREYLRNLYKNTDNVKDNIEYKEALNDAFEKNPKGKEEHIMYQYRISKIAFESFLRDKALDNIFNNTKLFTGNKTAADKLGYIKSQYKDLLQTYPVLQVLNPLSTISAGKLYSNIQLQDNLDDSEKVNSYYKNIRDLADPTVVKVPGDPEANKYISDFFTSLPIIGTLQSGSNTKTRSSFTRLMPYDLYLRLIEKPAQKYVENMSDLLLDVYYYKWSQQNSILNKNKNKFEDYYITEITLDRLLKSSRKNLDKVEIEKQIRGLQNKNQRFGLRETEDIFYKQPSGASILDTYELLKRDDKETDESYNPRKVKYMRELLEANPDKIFVYNNEKGLDRSIPKQGTSDRLFRNQGQSNAFGLNTYNQYNLTETTFIKDVDGDVNPNFKIDFDAQVKELLRLQNEEGKEIVFPSSGFLQEQMGYQLEESNSLGKNTYSSIVEKKLGQKTYEYASQVLFEKFGYVNRNYDITPIGKLVIGAKQKESKSISDEMVRDLMSHCYS